MSKDIEVELVLFAEDSAEVQHSFREGVPFGIPPGKPGTYAIALYERLPEGPGAMRLASHIEDFAFIIPAMHRAGIEAAGGSIRFGEGFQAFLRHFTPEA